MTIKEIRLTNLLLLLKQTGLSKTAFALKAATSPVYLFQITSAKTRRNVGNLLARSIERAFQKPRGWMDRQHPLEE